ncbi:hypothetical protein [Hymenobacter norwichensis]|uniref:hypothetical protein n=1 Tax=Hymenobacter norwichensis TaxID=223903 RepID=UPI0003B54882|nr:hypothetical protein [Hymenobacter norwichensis]
MSSQPKLITQSKSTYGPTTHGVYCLGSKSECSHLEEDGAVRLNWGKTPEPEQLANIQSLYLLPTTVQLAKSPHLPDFIRKLGQLRFLELPLPLALTLQPDALPASLESLTLLHWEQYAGGLNIKDARWPGLTLTGLKSFSILSGFGAPELPSLLGVSNEVFPQLEHLSCRLDKKGEVLAQLADFTSLRHLELEFAYNHNIFASINSPLQSLSLEGANKEFPLARITVIPTLELLWLNGIKADINCALFQALPNLREISVLNSKKVANAQELLQCPKLESIYFLDCGNPFKGVKNQFQEAKYEMLDIDFS